MTADMVAEAIKVFLVAVSEELTSEDELLVDRAKSRIKQKFAHGFHQLLSLGIDQDGNEYEGLQLDCPIGQDSVCAEVSSTSRAVQNQAEMTTIVTVHHKRIEEGGEVHVVGSCMKCCERLLHFFPEIKVIVHFDGKLRKVPVRALIPLPYKQRVRNGQGSTQKFGE